MAVGLTQRTFTKDTALSENGRGAAWHVWINAARHGRGTAWARHCMCELALNLPAHWAFLVVLSTQLNLEVVFQEMCHSFNMSLSWIQQQKCAKQLYYKEVPPHLWR
jgi:hypothetical protein